MKKFLSLLLAVLMVLGLCGVSAADEAADDVEALKARIEELELQLAKAERAITAAKSNAYIAYANADWSVQNWGTADSEDGKVTVTPAAVNGAGDYTVGLEFAEPAQGLAFTGLMIDNGELLFPNWYLTIKEIRVNGEKLEIKKGYTSSDDGKVTRCNIYNEWVSALPNDARRLDGDLGDASWIIVDKEAFASVSSMEVDFSFGPAKAYLMYADAAWAMQNWGYESTADVTVTTADITGEGDYTVGLSFATPSEGLAFTALGIKNGEKDFPNWVFDVTGVEVNGTALEIKKDYTSSDDGKETRSNIYNEWVSALPDDARSNDALEDCSWIIVDPAAFTGVTDVKVNFHVTKREPVAAAAAAGMSAEEAAELQKADYNAYIGVQTESYIFRNTWDEANYGRDSEANPGFFGRLTGWDADGNAVDYGGTFTDALLNNAGTYTVSLKTGEMGFGSDSYFRMLFVSTEIPSALISEGYVKITDVKTKIGDAKTQDFTSVDLSGTYAVIKVIDEYNQSEAPFGYTVPGADTEITITFTVEGLTE